MDIGHVRQTLDTPCEHRILHVDCILDTPFGQWALKVDSILDTPCGCLTLYVDSTLGFLCGHYILQVDCILDTPFWDWTLYWTLHVDIGHVMRTLGHSRWTLDPPCTHLTLHVDCILSGLRKNCTLHMDIGVHEFRTSAFRPVHFGPLSLSPFISAP